MLPSMELFWQKGLVMWFFFGREVDSKATKIQLNCLFAPVFFAPAKVDRCTK